MARNKGDRVMYKGRINISRERERETARERAAEIIREKRITRKRGGVRGREIERNRVQLHGS